MVFSLLYMISFLLVINSDDWFLIWIGLELNMLSFILLIYRQNSLNYIESCLKYFFVQSLGSAILMAIFYLSKTYFIYIGSFILTYKIGGGPFFFWFPSVCCGLEWSSCFMLMSFQKFIPLMLMLFFISWVLWSMIIVSLFLGTMGSFNQKNMKRLMAFSSIHHLGWLMVCICIDSSVWLYYLIMYSCVIFPFIFMMKSFKVNDLMNLGKWKIKWLLIMYMLSMAGMPPFLGFFLKWMAFYYILKMDFSLIMFMVFMSAIMFYVYTRILYDFLSGLGVEISWIYKNFMSKYMLKIDVITIIGMVTGMMLMTMVMV